MQSTLRVALAQVNLCVGDMSGNATKVVHWAARAKKELGADVIVFPELALTGYPPEDLLLRPGLYRRIAEALGRIREQTHGIDVVLGYPWRTEAGAFNSASLLRDGQVVATYEKQHLPNYGVFDEKRYFVPGSAPVIVDLKGIPVGLSICEDIWVAGPMQQAVAAGARLMLNLNASPFHVGKWLEREATLRDRVWEGRIPVVYVNLVGGQDELVFDGGSLVMGADGEVYLRAESFTEDLYTLDFNVVDGAVVAGRGHLSSMESEDGILYGALVQGVKDYIGKNRFAGAVIGLSGGIDSALTLAIAVDALGAQQVEAVMMPSRYTAAMSLEDARTEARALGVTYREISIEPAFRAFLHSLRQELAGTAEDVTEQNIQARCRGVILMAISNKLRKMVLTTGNKSEMAVGYATLYGDMAGGFAPLKDVPKTLVYRLARHRNGISPVIPARVLSRAPSAELAADQRDVDSLPPYEVLDPILELYVEHDLCMEDIVAAGFEEPAVRHVIGLVDRNEYKRRQAPPGVRISRRAFGRDRRYPITSGYNR